MGVLNPANEVSIIQTERRVVVKRLHWFRYDWTATQASVTAVNNIHASVTMTTASQTITADITQPTCCRCLSVTGGASQTGVVTINGTNIDDVPISESFTMISSTLIPGTKAFKTVTSIVYPPYTVNATKTVVVGDSDILGLPLLLPSTTCIFATYVGGTLEATAATVTVSTTALCSNTLDPNSSLAGTAVYILGYIYT